MNMKLGLKRPNNNLPALKVSQFLSGVLPVIPVEVDYFDGVEFSDYENSKFGVCGPASVGNYRRCVTSKLLGKLVAPTQDDVFELYRESGNANFNPSLPSDSPQQQDNGVIMREMLERLRAKGIGGQKCLAFAKVDHTNIDELKISAAVFGGLLLGVDLQTAQQKQTEHGVWDYVEGSDDWGGHAVLSGKFSGTAMNVITWNQDVQMTPEFINKRLMEAWVVVFGEHFTNSGFLTSIDFKALQDAFKTLTGKTFPSWDLPEDAWKLI